MRVTTKIILGIIGALFALSLVLIIGYSFSDKRYRYHAAIDLPQTPQSILAAAPCRVVVLTGEMSRTDSIELHKGHYPLLPVAGNGGLYLHMAATPEEAGTLLFPAAMEGCVAAQTLRDTLFITLNPGKLYRKLRDTTQTRGYLMGLNLHLCLPAASSVDVINRLSPLGVTATGLSADTLRISGGSRISIDSCTIGEATLRCYGQLQLAHSTIGTLNLDLDHSGNFTVDSCTIAVENLSGSRQHAVQQPGSEAKTVHWLPKNKQATLRMTLYGDTTRVEFP